MENKYYTPEIEEFCIGFECEIKNIIDTIINFTKRKEAILNYMLKIKFKGIRVKYLDKYDIGCFGFKRELSTFSEVLETTCDIYINEQENIVLRHYPQLNKVAIATKEVHKGNIVPKFGWDDKQVNLITIKNKTEFKKLLKQLEIL